MESWIPAEIDWLRLDLLMRLLLAAFLGGVIGLEREVHGKPAGFRTNLLICVGSALLTEMSVFIALGSGGDPGRIAAQIVSGMGFLGAGTIIQSRGSVVGLTTAATMWVVAAIGIAVGAEAYVEAVGATVLVLVALFALGRIEDALVRRRAYRTLQIVLTPEPRLLRAVEEVLRAEGMEPRLTDVDRGRDSMTALYSARAPVDRIPEAIRHLLDIPGVRKVTQV